MKIFLIAPRQKEDRLTKITHSWAVDLQEWLKQYPLEVFPFLAEEAIGAKVIPVLKKNQGQKGIVVFLDHGNRDRFSGTDKKSILDLSHLTLLNNKFIYALACKSAMNLGHESLLHGALGYIGFNHDFFIDPKNPRIMGNCLLRGLRYLIDKKGEAAYARKAIVNAINTSVIELVNQSEYQSKHKIHFAPLITALRHNRDYLVHLGDPHWSISE